MVEVIELLSYKGWEVSIQNLEDVEDVSEPYSWTAVHDEGHTMESSNNYTTEQRANATAISTIDDWDNARAAESGH